MTVRLARSAVVAAWLRTLSPLALSAMAAVLVAILWRGGWPPETAAARIDWLGWTLIGLILSLGLSLFLVGGIRTIRVKGGPVEASINDDSDGADGVPKEERT